MKFRARTNNKRQLEINWDLINTYVSKWKPGTLLDVEIVRRQEKRSDPMRKMYWSAILPPFALHLGYDPDEFELFHRQLKIVYFRVQPDEKGIHRDVPSIFSNESDLPISEKREFIEWIMRKAAIEGVYIEPLEN